MRFFLAGVLGLAVIFGACSKSGESEGDQAVRAALDQYLQTKGNLSLSNMTMKVQSVKINGDKADADVRFESKQQPDVAVGIRYVLKRAGDHWEVESSSPQGGMGMDPHQSMGSAHGMNPQGGADAAGAIKPEANH
jgi:hypothetical protein